MDEIGLCMDAQKVVNLFLQSDVGHNMYNVHESSSHIKRSNSTVRTSVAQNAVLVCKINQIMY